MALKLTGIFGQDQVFYDSWSIRPGDGIIDQMNKGLEAPEFVFFFVSANKNGQKTTNIHTNSLNI